MLFYSQKLVLNARFKDFLYKNNKPQIWFEQSINMHLGLKIPAQQEFLTFDKYYLYSLNQIKV